MNSVDVTTTSKNKNGKLFKQSTLHTKDILKTRQDTHYILEFLLSVVFFKSTETNAKLCRL